MARCILAGAQALCLPNHSYHQRYADYRSAQGFDALNLFPLQINPHFTNALPEGHKGETREQRIRELLVVAPELTIIGLPEGNWITGKGHATLVARTPLMYLRLVKKRCRWKRVTVLSELPDA